MRSSKSRSRGKNRNNNNRSMGNVVNRVFDSSGPEGKVRGTPQQIIDKYQQLHRDAQLSGDRVAAENFAQHAEHYARLLGEALREQEARREQQEAQQAQQNQARQQRERDDTNSDGSDGRNNRRGGDGRKRDEQPVDLRNTDQPDVIDLSADKAGEDSGLVETVESAPAAKPRKPRTRKPKPVVDAPAETGEPTATDEKPAAE